MNPTPAKRARRTSSPDSTAAETSPLQTHRRTQTGSPIHPILPAPVPSGLPRPPSAAGPSGWQSTWPAGSSRRSIDAVSPSAGSSPRMEQIGETGEVVFTRDVNSRAPRSMMACTRCRRQKMKCDGPSSIPCRGCRQSGQACVFEPRSRPKSISVMPSRPPPFFTGRPGSPAAFYPPGPQPAPPITSRAPPSESYLLRQTREPMPPPPAASIAALASPYPSGRHTPPRPTTAVSVTGPGPPGPSTAYYNPQPMLIHPPPFTATSGGPPGGPPSHPQTQTPSGESRLRSIESAIRSFSSIPSAISSLQNSINAIQRSIAPRRNTDLSEATWENYRTRAWPLTPWLVGLREASGLSGLVVSLLGKRAAADRDEGRRRECEVMMIDVRKEIGKLLGENSEWTREEIRALGVMATWTSDATLAALAIAEARSLGLDRLSPSRTHDDWREWIYFVIMDHLCHLPEHLQPVIRESLAAPWREKLAANPSTDPAVRDRDHKLLAWLEYAETLAEGLHLQRVARAATPLDIKDDIALAEDRRSRALEPWRKLGVRWEAWATRWGTRNDPILSLHYDYAVLFTTSPLVLVDEKVWENLSGQSEGLALLERGRDAAIGVIQAICSVEIGRTLPYSFGLYRPLLALSVLHLLSLAISLPGSQVISSAQVLSLFRQAYEAIVSHHPLDRSSPNTNSGIGLGISVHPPPSVLGLLGEVVESGRLEVGRRWIGVELGKETWRRVLG